MILTFKEIRYIFHLRNVIHCKATGFHHYFQTLYLNRTGFARVDFHNFGINFFPCSDFFCCVFHMRNCVSTEKKDQNLTSNVIQPQQGQKVQLRFYKKLPQDNLFSPMDAKNSIMQFFVQFFWGQSGVVVDSVQGLYSVKV